MASDAGPDENSNSDGGIIDLENLVRDIDPVAGEQASESSGATEESSKSNSAEAKSEPSRLAESADTLAPSPQKSSLTETAAPVEEPQTKVQADSPVVASQSADLSEEDFDSLLLEESPELAEEVSAIREVAKTSLEGVSELEIFDEELRAETGGGLLIRIRRRLNIIPLKISALIAGIKNLSVRMLRDSKGLVLELVERLKVGIRTSLHNRKAQLSVAWKWFRARTAMQRLSIVAAIVVLGLTIGVVYKMAKGTLLPKIEREWVASFEEKADGVFHYEANEPMEDFNDPILHPEFVVVIDRVVVNLLRSSDAEPGANPMAAFEFYIQADSQVGAMEVKDRDVEIRDQIARAVEQMTYPELATDEGKTRLKLILRKNLNEIMIKGRVRRVYFKTIVLNPE